MKDYTAFTPRELDTLKLMAQGLNNNEIAEALFIGISTVKTYVGHIYSKLGLTDSEKHVLRVNAVLYYLEHKEELEQ